MVPMSHNHVDVRGTLRSLMLPAGVLAAAAIALAGVVSAAAVSGGGYSWARQGCSPTADRNDRPESAQPGCHNATAQLNVGAWQPLAVGTDQTPNGTNVHSGSIVVDDGRGTSHTVRFDTGQGGAVTFVSNVAGWLAGGASGAPPPPDGVGGMPTLAVSDGRGAAGPDAHHPTASFYFGADDNLDVGEHDAVNPTNDHGRDRRVAHGPSDGGALQANVHPQGSTDDPASLAGNIAPANGHDPLPAADATGAGCADGLCAGVDTERRTMYQGGCRRCAGQAVYDDQNTTDWRSPDCNSGSTANQNDCGSNWQSGNEQGDITQPYDERGAYYDDPGVFVYEDPDPQSSPALPMYPICELYAGTEGVYACSNQVIAPPSVGAQPVMAAAPAPRSAAQPGMRTAVATSTPALLAGSSARPAAALLAALLG